MREKEYFLVRPINNNEIGVKNFIDNNIVAVGWSDVDFTKYYDFKDIFSELSYLNDISPQTAGRHKGQIIRFQSINAEDRIIIPIGSSICLATATKIRQYNEKQKNVDQANELVVNYIKTQNKEVLYIPRDSLSEGLQRKLRVRGMTVSNLNEFGEEIEKYFAKGFLEGIAYSWTEEFEEYKRGKVLDFKKKLLENICSGNTNLKTGGIGLEKLVLELIKLEGYTAYIPSKRAFPSYADADIIAVKTDKFVESKLLFQIKHHSGISDSWGLIQLLEIKKKLPEEFSNHQLIFITSAKVSEDVKKISEAENIIVMDGEALVDWIFELLKEITPKTKQQLGIVELPQML